MISIFNGCMVWSICSKPVTKLFEFCWLIDLFIDLKNRINFKVFIEHPLMVFLTIYNLYRIETKQWPLPPLCLRDILEPVPLLPRPKGEWEWTSQCSLLVIEKARLFDSTAGLGLLVLEKGVVPRDFDVLLDVVSRDLTSNLSLVFETDPWLAAG